MTIVKKKKGYKVLVRIWRKGNFFTMLGENVNWYSMENSVESPQKLENRITI
jgi:hypothetical protein